MIIKLQPDQIELFWDGIITGLIKSNKVPKEFHQDYSIHIRVKLLSGAFQAWICYDLNEDDSKNIIAIGITSIIDEKFHGVKILNIEGLYALRHIEDFHIPEAIESISEFAKANGCKVISADYSFDRVRDILSQMGFEEHRTICRKFI